MPLERLGESNAFAFALLELLERAGWESVVTRGFAGGTLLILTHRSGWEIKVSEPTLHEAVVEALREVSKVSAPRLAA